MPQTENTVAPTSPFKESENGVAPPSDSAPKLSCGWLANHKHGWQYGEQGVLEAIAKEIENDIPEEHRWCVEFGAGDSYALPLTCDLVMRKLKWKALLIEGSAANCDRLRRRVPGWASVVNAMVGLESSIATADRDSKTIDEHMEEAGCPASPGLMVVDVDSIDYYIVAHMQARPYILCVEHMDEGYPKHPRAAFVPRLEDAGKLLPKEPGQTVAFQLTATAQAFDITVPSLGYTLVFRTRINSVYVRNDVVGRVAKPPDGKIRLNLGAGAYNDPRYIPLDIKTGTDIRKLPYADGTVDEVYASHVLEHFGIHEKDAVLREWVRVLKPGGILRIAVPDARTLAKEMLGVDENGNYRDTEMVLYGAQSDETNYHKSMYTDVGLREAMNRAGLGNVVRFDPFMEGDCSNSGFSLNLEGTKRWWPRIENPRVTLVLNQPRLAFTGHEMRLIELAKKLNYEVQPVSGAFWDRDMTEATKMAMGAHKPDFLLYSDYDSVFEADDVLKMLKAINSDPEMAAIGAVQMARGNDKPLVFEDHVDYSTPISRVNFHHFGLTIVRAAVFPELPKPWMWSIPGRDQDGNWDWDLWSRTDADITFWRNMAMMGFKVCQHNEVCIGHIVQCVKYPSNTGKGVRLIPIENYWRHGKPKDAVLNPDLYKAKQDPASPLESAPIEVRTPTPPAPGGTTHCPPPGASSGQGDQP